MVHTTYPLMDKQCIWYTLCSKQILAISLLQDPTATNGRERQTGVSCLMSKSILYLHSQCGGKPIFRLTKNK